MSLSKPLHSRLIHISLSYWTTYRSLKIILEWELSRIRIQIQIQCLMQNHCFKKHSL